MKHQETTPPPLRSGLPNARFHNCPKTSEVDILPLRTARLRLIPATVSLLQAELADRHTFASLLGATVPENWPPETAADATPWFLEQTEIAPDERLGWLAWYALFVPAENEAAILVAGAGFKGPPRDGTVETGYSVLPQFQRQGFASEIVGALLGWAFRSPDVRRILADTQPHNLGSLRVLAKLGFRPIGPGEEEGSLMFELSRGELVTQM